MNIKDMPPIAITLLLTGVFFIIALVVLGAMQTATVTSTTTSEEYTVPALNANVTLAHYRITSVINVKNSTGTVLGTGNYTYHNPTATSSYLQTLSNSTLCRSGDTCTVTYKYDNYDSKASKSVDSSVTATTEIPSNWLLLIATIIAASIVIGIVLSNLGSVAGRE